MPKITKEIELIDIESGKDDIVISYDEIADIYAVDNLDGDFSEDCTSTNDEFCCIELKDGNRHVVDWPLQSVINLVRNYMRFKVGEALDLNPQKVYLRKDIKEWLL